MNQQSTLVLEPPLQLTVIEVREPMGNGLTSPWLAVALDENEEEIQIVLKLRDPGVPVGNSHFGGTSLACELLCSMLARAIGLNVPDYAVVQVTPAFVDSIHKSQDRDLFRRNIGENFGSVYQASLGLWNPNYQAISQEVLEQLEGTLTFDSTVINGDRTSQKPNLLYRG